MTTEPEVRARYLLPDVDEPTRPALEKLWRDQMGVVHSFLDGFESRVDVLRWCQRAIVATLGELPDEWFESRLLSEAELSVLVVDDDRRARLLEDLDVDPLSQKQARAYRDALVGDDLLPACREATIQFRWSAVERVADDDEDGDKWIDLENQSTPAMRPAFAELQQRQEWVVDRAIRGVEDVDELTTWFMVLVRATFGEIDDELARAFWREGHLRQAFVRSGRDARLFRVGLLARDVLPAMNRATAKLANRAGEAVETAESTDQSPLTYR